MTTILIPYHPMSLQLIYMYKEWVSVNFIYGYAILKWLAVIWLNDSIAFIFVALCVQEADIKGRDK